MTDIHIQPGAENEFQKAIIKAASFDPDFIITGGDLVMDALEVKKTTADSLFELYKRICSLSPVPVYNTPGNHDIWGWGLKNADTLDPDYGYGMFKRLLGNPFQLFSHKGIFFLILPSVVYNSGSAYVGSFSHETLKQVKETLQTVPKDAPLVLITHIPILTAETQWEEGALIPNHPMTAVGNSSELLTLLSEHNLKLILQGHLHIYERIEIAGVQIITGGAVSGKWWQGVYKKTPRGFLLVDVNGSTFSTQYITY
jgi:3',5'-cyclic AMP phosphodiesterase CpdA